MDLDGPTPRDARTLMAALRATPPGQIEETLDDMTEREREILRQAFTIAAAMIDVQTRPRRRRRRRARGPSSRRDR